MSTDTPRELLGSYFDSAPNWAISTYHQDPTFHRMFNEGAVRLDSLEDVLWRLAGSLYEQRNQWRDTVANHEPQKTLIIAADERELTQLRAENERLRVALTGLVDHYVAFVNSGDGGFWDPEKDTVVITARQALNQGNQ